MRLVLALPILLAACDGPFEELWPRQTFTVTQDERVFTVSAQYDPIEYAWFTRVSEFGGRLEQGDRDRAIFLVEKQVGPKLCEGGELVFTPGVVWGSFGPGYAHYMPTLGAWQIVAECA